MMHYSVSGMDECVPCNLPLALVDNRCVWWHLPLLALGLGALGVCGGLVFSWNRSRKAKKIERILEEVYMELWDEQPNTLDAYSKKLYGLGLQKVNFDQHISGMRALQSQRAGVSGWQTAQVETKGSVSSFLFEKTDGAHISDMLAVQSQRAEVANSAICNN